jgi:hypothetical protein
MGINNQQSHRRVRGFLDNSSKILSSINLDFFGCAFRIVNVILYNVFIAALN